jgi:hypothetical protein
MEVDFVTGGSRYQVLMSTSRSPTPMATSVAQMITGSLKIG